jgi:hypothetical protein
LHHLDLTQGPYHNLLLHLTICFDDIEQDLYYYNELQKVHWKLLFNNDLQHPPIIHSHNNSKLSYFEQQLYHPLIKQHSLNEWYYLLTFPTGVNKHLNWIHIDILCQHLNCLIKILKLFYNRGSLLLFYQDEILQDHGYINDLDLMNLI